MVVWYNVIMVNEIRAYESFLRKELKMKKGGEKLFKLHQERIIEFQHERLVHLLIMLFFIFMAVMFLIGTGVLCVVLPIKGNETFFLPLGFLDLILTVLSVAYVRHYYYLENLTQRLYKYTDKILGY